MPESLEKTRGLAIVFVVVTLAKSLHSEPARRRKTNAKQPKLQLSRTTTERLDGSSQETPACGVMIDDVPITGAGYPRLSTILSAPSIDKSFVPGAAALLAMNNASHLAIDAAREQ